MFSGIPCYMDTPTNQQFAILENARYVSLREKVPVGFWSNPAPAHTVVRLATAWYTEDAWLTELDALLP